MKHLQDDKLPLLQDLLSKNVGILLTSKTQVLMVFLNSFCKDCWLIKVHCKRFHAGVKRAEDLHTTQGLPDVECNSVATHQLQANVSKFKCSSLRLVFRHLQVCKVTPFLKKE